MAESCVTSVSWVSSPAVVSEKSAFSPQHIFSRQGRSGFVQYGSASRLPRTVGQVEVTPLQAAATDPAQAV